MRTCVPRQGPREALMSNPDFQLPTQPSSSDALKNIDDWEKLVSTSLERAQASAEVWRNGLAGFVTILTSVLILKGPEAASSMPLCWRIGVGALFLLGVAAAIAALWQALSAASPKLTIGKSVADVTDEWGSVEAFKVGNAGNVLSRLALAKGLMLVALSLLGVGYIVWWSAPAPETSISISTDGDEVCGTLITSGNGQFAVLSNGHESFVEFEDVESMTVDAEC